MDFLLKFLILGGRYLTQITAQSIIEAYRRSIRLRQRLSLKFENNFRMTGHYENILELYNEHLDELSRSPQMQLAFISDAHRMEFETYLKEIEEEGNLKQLQRLADEKMLLRRNSVVDEQFSKIEENIKIDSLLAKQHAAARERSKTPIFNIPRKTSSFRIPQNIARKSAEIDAQKLTEDIEESRRKSFPEDTKAKLLHREWVSRNDRTKLQDEQWGVPGGELYGLEDTQSTVRFVEETLKSGRLREKTFKLREEMVVPDEPIQWQEDMVRTKGSNLQTPTKLDKEREFTGKLPKKEKTTKESNQLQETVQRVKAAKELSKLHEKKTAAESNTLQDNAGSTEESNTLLGNIETTKEETNELRKLYEKMTADKANKLQKKAETSEESNKFQKKTEITKESNALLENVRTSKEANELKKFYGKVTVNESNKLQGKTRTIEESIKSQKNRKPLEESSKVNAEELLQKKAKKAEDTNMLQDNVSTVEQVKELSKMGTVEKRNRISDLEYAEELFLKKPGTAEDTNMLQENVSTVEQVKESSKEERNRISHLEEQSNMHDNIDHSKKAQAQHGKMWDTTQPRQLLEKIRSAKELNSARGKVRGNENLADIKETKKFPANISQKEKTTSQFLTKESALELAEMRASDKHLNKLQKKENLEKNHPKESDKLQKKVCIATLKIINAKKFNELQKEICPVPLEEKIAGANKLNNAQEKLSMVNLNTKIADAKRSNNLQENLEKDRPKESNKLQDKEEIYPVALEKIAGVKELKKVQEEVGLLNSVKMIVSPKKLNDLQNEICHTELEEIAAAKEFINEQEQKKIYSVALEEKIAAKKLNKVQEKVSVVNLKNKIVDAKKSNKSWKREKACAGNLENKSPNESNKLQEKVSVVNLENKSPKESNKLQEKVSVVNLEKKMVNTNKLNELQKDGRKVYSVALEKIADAKQEKVRVGSLEKIMFSAKKLNQFQKEIYPHNLAEMASAEKLNIVQDRVCLVNLKTKLAIAKKSNKFQEKKAGVVNLEKNPNKSEEKICAIEFEESKDNTKESKLRTVETNINNVDESRKLYGMKGRSKEVKKLQEEISIPEEHIDSAKNRKKSHEKIVELQEEIVITEEPMHLQMKTDRTKESIKPKESVKLEEETIKPEESKELQNTFKAKKVIPLKGKTIKPIDLVKLQKTFELQEEIVIPEEPIHLQLKTDRIKESINPKESVKLEEETMKPEESTELQNTFKAKKVIPLKGKTIKPIDLINSQKTFELQEEIVIPEEPMHLQIKTDRTKESIKPKESVKLGEETIKPEESAELQNTFKTKAVALKGNTIRPIDLIKLQKITRIKTDKPIKLQDTKDIPVQLQNNEAKIKETKKVENDSVKLSRFLLSERKQLNPNTSLMSANQQHKERTKLQEPIKDNLVNKLNVKEVKSRDGLAKLKSLTRNPIKPQELEKLRGSPVHTFKSKPIETSKSDAMASKYTIIESKLPSAPEGDAGSKYTIILRREEEVFVEPVREEIVLKFGREWESPELLLKREKELAAKRDLLKKYNLYKKSKIQTEPGKTIEKTPSLMNSQSKKTKKTPSHSEQNSPKAVLILTPSKGKGSAEEMTKLTAILNTDQPKDKPDPFTKPESTFGEDFRNSSAVVEERARKLIQKVNSKRKPEDTQPSQPISKPVRPIMILSPQRGSYWNFQGYSLESDEKRKEIKESDLINALDKMKKESLHQERLLLENQKHFNNFENRKQTTEAKQTPKSRRSEWPRLPLTDETMRVQQPEIPFLRKRLTGNWNCFGFSEPRRVEYIEENVFGRKKNIPNREMEASWLGKNMEAFTAFESRLRDNELARRILLLDSSGSEVTKSNEVFAKFEEAVRREEFARSILLLDSTGSEITKTNEVEEAVRGNEAQSKIDEIQIEGRRLDTSLEAFEDLEKMLDLNLLNYKEELAENEMNVQQSKSVEGETPQGVSNQIKHEVSEDTKRENARVLDSQEVFYKYEELIKEKLDVQEHEVFDELEAVEVLDVKNKEIEISLNHLQSENQKAFEDLEIFLNLKLVDDVKVKKSRNLDDFVGNQEAHILKKNEKAFSELEIILNYKLLQDKMRRLDDVLPRARMDFKVTSEASGEGGFCENPELFEMDELHENVVAILKIIEEMTDEMDQVDIESLKKVKEYIAWKQENIDRYLELYEMIKKPSVDEVKALMIRDEVESIGALMEINDAECKRLMRNITHKLLDFDIGSPRKSKALDIIPLFLECKFKIDQEELQNQADLIEVNKRAFAEMEENIKVVRIIDNKVSSKLEQARVPMLRDQIVNLNAPKSPRGIGDKDASRKYTTDMKINPTNLPSCFVKAESSSLVSLEVPKRLSDLDYDQILKDIEKEENVAGLRDLQVEYFDKQIESRLVLDEEIENKALMKVAERHKETDSLGFALPSIPADFNISVDTGDKTPESLTPLVLTKIISSKRISALNPTHDLLGMVGKNSKGELAPAQKKTNLEQSNSWDKICNQGVRNYSQKPTPEPAESGKVVETDQNQLDISCCGDEIVSNVLYSQFLDNLMDEEVKSLMKESQQQKSVADDKFVNIDRVGEKEVKNLIFERPPWEDGDQQQEGIFPKIEKDKDDPQVEAATEAATKYAHIKRRGDIRADSHCNGPKDMECSKLADEDGFNNPGKTRFDGTREKCCDCLEDQGEVSQKFPESEDAIIKLDLSEILAVQSKVKIQKRNLVKPKQSGRNVAKIEGNIATTSKNKDREKVVVSKSEVVVMEDKNQPPSLKFQKIGMNASSSKLEQDKANSSKKKKSSDFNTLAKSNEESKAKASNKVQPTRSKIAVEANRSKTKTSKEESENPYKHEATIMVLEKKMQNTEYVPMNAETFVRALAKIRPVKSLWSMMGQAIEEKGKELGKKINKVKESSDGKHQNVAKASESSVKTKNEFGYRATRSQSAIPAGNAPRQTMMELGISNKGGGKEIISKDQEGNLSKSKESPGGVSEEVGPLKKKSKSVAMKKQTITAFNVTFEEMKQDRSKPPVEKLETIINAGESLVTNEEDKIFPGNSIKSRENESNQKTATSEEIIQSNFQHHTSEHVQQQDIKFEEVKKKAIDKRPVFIWGSKDAPKDKMELKNGSMECKMDLDKDSESNVNKTLPWGSKDAEDKDPKDKSELKNGSMECKIVLDKNSEANVTNSSLWGTKYTEGNDTKDKRELKNGSMEYKMVSDNHIEANVTNSLSRGSKDNGKLKNIYLECNLVLDKLSEANVTNSSLAEDNQRTPILNQQATILASGENPVVPTGESKISGVKNKSVLVSKPSRVGMESSTEERRNQQSVGELSTKCMADENKVNPVGNTLADQKVEFSSLKEKELKCRTHDNEIDGPNISVGDSEGQTTNKWNYIPKNIEDVKSTTKSVSVEKNIRESERDTIKECSSVEKNIRDSERDTMKKLVSFEQNIRDSTMKKCVSAEKNIRDSEKDGTTKCISVGKNKKNNENGERDATEKYLPVKQNIKGVSSIFVVKIDKEASSYGKDKKDKIILQSEGTKGFLESLSGENKVEFGLVIPPDDNEIKAVVPYSGVSKIESLAQTSSDVNTNAHIISFTEKAKHKTTIFSEEKKISITKAVESKDSIQTNDGVINKYLENKVEDNLKSKDTTDGYHAEIGRAREHLLISNSQKERLLEAELFENYEQEIKNVNKFELCDCCSIERNGDDLQFRPNSEDKRILEEIGLKFHWYRNLMEDWRYDSRVDGGNKENTDGKIFGEVNSKKINKILGGVVTKEIPQEGLTNEILQEGDVKEIREGETQWVGGEEKIVAPRRTTLLEKTVASASVSELNIEKKRPIVEKDENGLPKEPVFYKQNKKTANSTTAKPDVKKDGKDPKYAEKNRGTLTRNTETKIESQTNNTPGKKGQHLEENPKGLANTLQTSTLENHRDHIEKLKSNLKITTHPTNNPLLRRILFKEFPDPSEKPTSTHEDFIQVTSCELDDAKVVTYTPPIVEAKPVIPEVPRVAEPIKRKTAGMINNLQQGSDYGPIRIFKNSIWNWEENQKKAISAQQLYGKEALQYVKAKKVKEAAAVKQAKKYKYERKEIKSALGKPVTVTYLVEEGGKAK